MRERREEVGGRIEKRGGNNTSTHHKTHPPNIMWGDFCQV